MNDLNNSFGADAGWKTLPAEMEAELHQILLYWQRYAVDPGRDGFYGRIDQENNVHERAPRGSVLNARILWTFSAAYNQLHHPVYLELAHRAYQWLRSHMMDRRNGGLFWSVDWLGRPQEPHKQVYAQAFGIYGMSEYYRASRDPQALEEALALYVLIEQYSRDHHNGGYIDAFSRDWSHLEDKRLSAKDENANKTMNTHLHVVEAYANLYLVHPTPKLRQDVRELLQIFNEKIINKKTLSSGFILQ